MSALASTSAGFSAYIRTARPADIDALLALERASFAAEPSSRRAIRHALRSPTMSVLAALAEPDAGMGRAETLIGAAVLERRRNSRTARLSSIAVSPARAGQGLGGLLLDAAEADCLDHGCTRLRLEARTDNGAAIRLYERHGYRRCAVKRGYYEDGAAAWCYEKALAAP